MADIYDNIQDSIDGIFSKVDYAGDMLEMMDKDTALGAPWREVKETLQDIRDDADSVMGRVEEWDNETEDAFRVIVSVIENLVRYADSSDLRMALSYLVEKDRGEWVELATDASGRSPEDTGYMVANNLLGMTKVRVGMISLLEGTL